MNIAHIQLHLPVGTELLADLPGFKNPLSLYTGILPDITVVNKGRAVILELTCFYETNLILSKQFKLDKYKNPSNFFSEPLTFKVITVEISSLGLLSPRA